MSRLGDLRALLAERWQIPLAFVALFVAGSALYKLKPERTEVPLDALVADVLALAEAGRYHDATNALANLLKMEPAPTRREQAALHDTLADLILAQERLRPVPIPGNVELLLENHEAAHRLGHPPDARGALRAAQAHEWLGDVRTALRAYEAVLDREPEPIDRRNALHALVRLLEEQPEYADRRRAFIETLLLEEGVEPVFLWTTLRQAIGEALDRADLPRATDLLVRFADRLQRSDLQGYRDFLWAWVLTESGDLDGATERLAQADAWLNETPRSDPTLDRAGFLPALTAWLHGRLNLLESRPQQALMDFRQAAELQNHGDVFGHASVGQVRALAALQRHPAAREAATAPLVHLSRDPASLAIVRPRIRTALLELITERHRANDPDNTIAYAELAMHLTGTEPEQRLQMHEILGREYQWAAENHTDSDTRRSMHRGAAENYEAAARFATLEDQRYATLLWDAANQFDQAGLARESQRLLAEFVASRDTDPRLPQALLQLGQTYVVQGDFPAAIELYEDLILRFPRLEEATTARLALAECQIALGETHYASAERTLIELLELGSASPQAAVYRDGLYALCDLYYQRDQHAPAISRIEEFLSFYPEDAESKHLRFMLADSYRRSAYRLAELEDDGQAAVESRRRFRRAAEMFREYWARLGNTDPVADRAAATYERLALFYRGDCLYELNEPSALQEALATYRQAAARYQNHPATLTAQVQIANIHLRQGRIREAGAAIERARWQLGNITDEAFAETPDGSDRIWWQRYLATLADSTTLAGIARGNTP